jgi:hypothetical protein
MSPQLLLVTDLKKGGGGGRGRGGYQGNTPGDAPRSNLPPLPNDVPIPEGARQVPYLDLQVRGTVGEKVMVQVNHHTIDSLPTKAIYQYVYHCIHEFSSTNMPLKI